METIIGLVLGLAVYCGMGLLCLGGIVLLEGVSERQLRLAREAESKRLCVKQ